MNCEGLGKLIPLYFYGELSPDEEEQFDEHLVACDDCRQDVEKYTRVARAIDAQEATVPEGLLADCRRHLAGAMVHERAPGRAASRQNAWRQLRDGLAGILAPLHIRGGFVLKPLASVALVALGYFSARIGNAPNGPSLAGMLPDSFISSVRSVQPDANGRIQIALDETRRRVVTGAPDDANIQRLLLAAARDRNNPGVRVESLEILKTRSGSNEVRDVLLEAVLNDPNPGVRLKAVEGLKAFPMDAEMRSTLSDVLLQDDNPGVRIQAIDLLVAHRDDSIVGVLQDLVQKENNNYVRLRCRNALQEMNASVGTF